MASDFLTISGLKLSNRPSIQEMQLYNSQQKKRFVLHRPISAQVTLLAPVAGLEFNYLLFLQIKAVIVTKSKTIITSISIRESHEPHEPRPPRAALAARTRATRHLSSGVVMKPILVSFKRNSLVKSLFIAFFLIFRVLSS